MSDYRERACTCHPDEAPKPCPQRYAYSECVLAAESERRDAAGADLSRQVMELQREIERLRAQLVSDINAEPEIDRLETDNERLRVMVEDACQVFDHYGLPEHAFHYRRALEGK